MEILFLTLIFMTEIFSTASLNTNGLSISSVEKPNKSFLNRMKSSMRHSNKKHKSQTNESSSTSASTSNMSPLQGVTQHKPKSYVKSNSLNQHNGVSNASYFCNNTEARDTYARQNSTGSTNSTGSNMSELSANSTESQQTTLYVNVPTAIKGILRQNSENSVPRISNDTSSRRHNSESSGTLPEKDHIRWQSDRQNRCVTFPGTSSAGDRPLPETPETRRSVLYVDSYVLNRQTLNVDVFHFFFASSPDLSPYNSTDRGVSIETDKTLIQIGFTEFSGDYTYNYVDMEFDRSRDKEEIVQQLLNKEYRSKIPEGTQAILNEIMSEILLCQAGGIVVLGVVYSKESFLTWGFNKRKLLHAMKSVIIALTCYPQEYVANSDAGNWALTNSELKKIIENVQTLKKRHTELLSLLCTAETYQRNLSECISKILQNSNNIELNGDNNSASSFFFRGNTFKQMARTVESLKSCVNGSSGYKRCPELFSVLKHIFEKLYQNFKNLETMLETGTKIESSDLQDCNTNFTQYMTTLVNVITFCRNIHRLNVEIVNQFSIIHEEIIKTRLGITNAGSTH